MKHQRTCGHSGRCAARSRGGLLERNKGFGSSRGQPEWARACPPKPVRVCSRNPTAFSFKYLTDHKLDPTRARSVGVVECGALFGRRGEWLSGGFGLQGGPWH